MKKIAFSLFVLTILSAMPAFAGGHKTHNKGIPDDFDARNTVLLIEDSPNERRSDKIELIMKKFYPYKYKIESNKDVRGMKRDSAYSDRSVYRYILANDEHLYYSSNNGAYSAEVYFIYDMLQEKAYKTIRAGNGFSAGSFT